MLKTNDENSLNSFVVEHFMRDNFVAFYRN